MKIIPLNQENIAVATQLILSSLPAQSKELAKTDQGPGDCLKHSLSKDFSYTEHISAVKWGEETGIDINRLEYFLAIDNQENIVGISGVYTVQPGYLEKLGIKRTQVTDRLQQPNHFWMAYTAVDPTKKGLGIGTDLMRHGVQIAMGMAEKDGTLNPKWTLLADPGAITFYKQYKMHPVGTFGNEIIFETPLQDLIIILDNKVKSHKLYIMSQV